MARVIHTEQKVAPHNPIESEENHAVFVIIIIIIIIIIIHVYIAAEPGNPVLRRRTMVSSLTQIAFNPGPTSTSNGAPSACWH